MRKIGAVVVGVCLAAAVSVETRAEEPASPSEYLDAIETPSGGAGVENEVDALEAQSEAIEDTGSAVGISTQRAERIEEIVVSARKRDEFLEDTPISVTALGVEEIRESNVQRIDDISQLVPNLQIERGTEGYSANIVIRGVGNPQAAALAFDPGVGVYVDGVYLARAMGSLLDVVDFDQIEVLRGPQGTLFGKNTVGGALNITTRKPQQELEGFVLVRPGNRSSVFTQAILNVPVIEDRLFVRGAFSSNNERGYSQNVDTDIWYSARNSVAFLGSLRFLATDDITIDISGTWSREHTTGAGGQCIWVDNPGAIAVEGFEANCEESTPRTNSSDVPGIVDLPSYGAWGTATWDAGALGPIDNLTLKSITSWREQKPRLRSDVDQTRSTVISRSSIGGVPEIDGLPGFQRQISQEFQVSGSSWEDRIQVIAGAFGYWEKGRDGQVLDVSALGLTTLNLREIDNWNWALFGQATVDPTEWLSLTAGLRYTQEKKGVFAKNIPGVLDESPTAHYDAWTPMASVALTLPEEELEDTSIDHVMGYFSYARGFRGGGFNAVINPQATGLDQFSPEFLDSFEVGFKTIALDQRLTVNLSVFLAKYKDMQVTTQIDTGGDDDRPLTIEQITTNAANATNQGAEIEIVALPMEGLMIRATLGLLTTAYDEFASFSNMTGAPLNRAGDAFDNAPSVQSHVAIQYSLPVELEGSLAGWLTPRIEWDYSSSFSLLFPEVTQGVQPAYHLLHARLSYSFLDDKAQVALWGRNLTDKDYMNAATPVASSFGFVVRYFNPPRSFGGEFSYSF